MDLEAERSEPVDPDDQPSHDEPPSVGHAENEPFDATEPEDPHPPEIGGRDPIDDEDERA